MLSSVEGALKSGDEVRIVGFGTFSVSSRAATTGRNPRTGEAISIRLLSSLSLRLVLL